MASPEVLALDIWKARVWKHLHDLFIRLPIERFYRWEPSGATGGVVFSKTAEFEIVPTGFSANELSVSVGDSSNTRDLQREREFMTWEVRLSFATEALTEYFDSALLKTGDLTIPQGTAADGTRIPSIFLNVVQVDFTHPPMESPSTGTQVRYTIQMIPGRV